MRLRRRQAPTSPSPAQELRTALAELCVVRDRLTDVTAQVQQAAKDIAKEVDK